MNHGRAPFDGRSRRIGCSALDATSRPHHGKQQIFGSMEFARLMVEGGDSSTDRGVVRLQGAAYVAGIVYRWGLRRPSLAGPGCPRRCPDDRRNPSTDLALPMDQVAGDTARWRTSAAPSRPCYAVNRTCHTPKEHEVELKACHPVGSSCARPVARLPRTSLIVGILGDAVDRTLVRVQVVQAVVRADRVGMCSGHGRRTSCRSRVSTVTPGMRTAPRQGGLV
jgi:hypothetical protein